VNPVSKIKPNSGILDITPYVAGESKSTPGLKITKLSSNEGAFGPPPGAVAAAQAALSSMHRYPDGGSTELRHALGTLNGIDPDLIVCGAGSDEILTLLCRAYAAPGDEAIYSAHGFLIYPIVTLSAGAKPVPVPEKNLKADVDAILAAVTARTKMVFLANPNNPTGSWLDKGEIRALIAALPEKVMFVLDSAYAEYVDDPAYSAGHELVSEFPNVVVTRTFSKVYGMGGLRLGWGHFSADVADVMNRVRGPFNVSSVAQAAGLAALADQDFVKRSVAHNTTWREWAVKRLDALRLPVNPGGAGNFVLTRFETPERAEACRLSLKSRGIMVRQVGAYGLPEYLRITIGAPDEIKLACDAIEDYIKSS